MNVWWVVCIGSTRLLYTLGIDSQANFHRGKYKQGFAAISFVQGGWIFWCGRGRYTELPARLRRVPRSRYRYLLVGCVPSPNLGLSYVSCTCGPCGWWAYRTPRSAAYLCSRIYGTASFTSIIPTTSVSSSTHQTDPASPQPMQYPYVLLKANLNLYISRNHTFHGIPHPRGE